MNKKTKQLVMKQVTRWSGPALSLASYALIIGFALSGIGLMVLSSFAWIFFGASEFPGFGLLTGGVFLSAATATFLFKLSKTEAALHRKAQATELV